MGHRAHYSGLVRSLSGRYVFGGFVRKLGYMFDVHVLHLGRVEWLPVQVGPHNAHPERHSAARRPGCLAPCVLPRPRMVLKPIWMSSQVGGTVPDGRINHSLCAHGRMLYLFGGAFKGSPFGEVYVLDTHEHKWELLLTRGLTPEPRSSHTAEMVRHNMFVFGGTNGTTALGDLLIFDTRSAIWARPRTSVCRGPSPNACRNVMLRRQPQNLHSLLPSPRHG